MVVLMMMMVMAFFFLTFSSPEIFLFLFLAPVCSAMDVILGRAPCVRVLCALDFPKLSN